MMVGHCYFTVVIIIINNASIIITNHKPMDNSITYSGDGVVVRKCFSWIHGSHVRNMNTT